MTARIAACLFYLTDAYKVCILWPNDTFDQLADRMMNRSSNEYLIYIRYGDYIEVSTWIENWSKLLQCSSGPQAIISIMDLF